MSNKNLSNGMRDTQRKFSYRWSATGTCNKILYGDRDTCVHCGQVEDHKHVLMYKAPVVVEARMTLWETKEDELTKLDSHPYLLTLIRIGVRAVKSKVLLDV